MTTTPPDDQELEFECPLCGGTFAIETRWLGHAVECPHCGDEVTLAAEGPEDEEPEGDERFGEQAADSPEDNPFAGIADGTAATSEFAVVEPATAEEPAVAPPAEPEPPAEPAAPLTPEEREALKRRVNAILAIAGVVILVGTFALLAWLASSG